MAALLPCTCAKQMLISLLTVCVLIALAVESQGKKHAQIYQSKINRTHTVPCT